MATPAAGIAIVWGTHTFTEVYSFAYTYGGNAPSRSTAEIGRAVVACYGTAGTSIVHHGEQALLTVTGGGTDLTAQALWTSVAASANRNDVTSYAVTFRLIEDL